MNELIQTIAVYAIPVIFAITLPSAAQGFVAYLFGDASAYQAGRVTLNPIRHIDPVGTLLVPLGILAMSTLFGGPPLMFGWAKPMPIDYGRMRRPKRDMLWVALAVPAANLVMSILWVLAIRLYFAIDIQEGYWYEMAQAGVVVNLVLMALSLLPILPLPGGQIVFSLLPQRMAWQYSKIEPYGMVIVIVLLVTGTLRFFMQPFLALGTTVVSWFL